MFDPHPVSDISEVVAEFLQLLLIFSGAVCLIVAVIESFLPKK